MYWRSRGKRAESDLVNDYESDGGQPAVSVENNITERMVMVMVMVNVDLYSAIITKVSNAMTEWVMIPLQFYF